MKTISKKYLVSLLSILSILSACSPGETRSRTDLNIHLVTGQQSTATDWYVQSLYTDTFNFRGVDEKTGKIIEDTPDADWSEGMLFMLVSDEQDKEYFAELPELTPVNDWLENSGTSVLELKPEDMDLNARIPLSVLIREQEKGTPQEFTLYFDVQEFNEVKDIYTYTLHTKSCSETVDSTTGSKEAFAKLFGEAQIKLEDGSVLDLRLELELRFSRSLIIVDPGIFC